MVGYDRSKCEIRTAVGDLRSGDYRVPDESILRREHFMTSASEKTKTEKMTQRVSSDVQFVSSASQANITKCPPAL